MSFRFGQQMNTLLSARKISTKTSFSPTEGEWILWAAKWSRFADCSEILIQEAKLWLFGYVIWMDDTYVQNSFLHVNYSMGKGTMLFSKWFKACTIKSSAWINSIAFFTENRNRTAWYRILWRTTHFEAKAACISAARAAGRFMS